MSHTADRIRSILRTTATVLVGGGRAALSPFKGRRVVSVLAGVVLGVALVHTTGVNPVAALQIGADLAEAIDQQAAPQ